MLEAWEIKRTRFHSFRRSSQNRDNRKQSFRWRQKQKGNKARNFHTCQNKQTLSSHSRNAARADRLPRAEGPVSSLWNLATCERRFVLGDDGSSSAQVLFSSQVTYKKKNSCGEHTDDVRVIARRDGITAQHLSQSLECVTATGSAEPFKSRGLIKSARPTDGGFTGVRLNLWPQTSAVWLAVPGWELFFPPPDV